MEGFDNLGRGLFYELFDKDNNYQAIMNRTLKKYFKNPMFNPMRLTLLLYLGTLSLAGVSCHREENQNVNQMNNPSDHQLRENQQEGTEVEDHDHFLESISSKGTTYSKEVAQDVETPMLPRGSSMITSAGQLVHSGIRAIIHAAIGSVTKTGGDFDPTLQAVASSIANSLQLARKNGHQAVAIPLIDGNNFAYRIGVNSASLAEFVIRIALLHRGNLKLVFVDDRLNFSASSFHQAYPRIKEELELQKDQPFIQIVRGDITQFSVHGCDAIMNAANMEIQFSRGISGTIRKAVGEQEAVEIESFAKEKILYFNQKVIKKLGHYTHLPSGAGNDPENRAPFDLTRTPPPSSSSTTGSSSSSSGLPPVPVVFPEPKTFRSWKKSNYTPPQDPNFSKYCRLPNDQGNSAFSSTEALRDALASFATPSPTTMIWYRWGQKPYEEDRVHLIPAFNVSSKMNIGMSVMGKGLYVASTPVASASYASIFRETKLTTIRAKPGTPILDLTDVNTKKTIARDLGIRESDVDPLVANCNPPVMVKYYAWVGGSWWVLKYNKGVIVEDFDGKYINTHDLFNYKNILQQNYWNKAHVHYWDSLKLTLKKRFYNPINPQQLPVSLTSMVRLQDWANHRRLKKLDTHIYIQGQSPQYLWRYDGTCGEYYRDGMILNEDDVNPDYCRAIFPTRLILEQKNQCIEKVQGESFIVVANTNYSVQDCRNWEIFSNSSPFYQYSENGFHPNHIPYSTENFRAAVIPVAQDTQAKSQTWNILLAKDQRQKGLWGIFKGNIQAKETLLLAAQRTLHEKSGGNYSPQDFTEENLAKSNYDVYQPSSGGLSTFTLIQKVNFLPATLLKKTQALIPAMIDDYAWVPVDQLQRAISVGSPSFTAKTPSGITKQVTLDANSFEILKQIFGRRIFQNLD